LERTVGARGGGIEIADVITFSGSFRAGETLTLATPPGLKLLRAGSDSRVAVGTPGGTVVLKPLADLDSITLKTDLAAPLRGASAVLGAWELPATVERATLALRSDGRQAPALKETPASLSPVSANANERKYECWGALPALEASLVPVTPPQPMQAAALLRLAPNEAVAAYEARIADPVQTEVVFAAPPQWTLTELAALKQEAPIPCSMTQMDGGRWRVGWDPTNAPDTVRFVLHRVGAWGAPGKSADLPVPLAAFEGPRPVPYEMRVQWPEELDARPTGLAALEVIPVDEAAKTRDGDAAKLAFRVTGDSPRGALAIAGRASDAQAVVATSLSLGEDRAKVRALIDYQVRFAPRNTFRFTLPPGIGRNVQIDGEGIRERTLNETPQGDEWAIVTQQNVLGSFRVALEWLLAGRPGVDPMRRNSNRSRRSKPWFARRGSRPPSLPRASGSLWRRTPWPRPATASSSRCACPRARRSGRCW
ncbi:MAG: hypothetical protein NTW86_28925, partial [Candidatus Sumerlaeota bacterium]|nr:hypothetical protein [Candidatus Sumerlaeota bacterium]